MFSQYFFEEYTLDKAPAQIYLPCKSDLECLVAGNEGGQLGEGLFARPSHPHKEGVTPGGADDPGHLHQMYHGILEEHQVHSWSSNSLIVLL